MTLPSSEHWRALSARLDELLDVPAEERAAWIERVRAADAALGDQLSELLAAHEDASRAGFLAGTAAPPPVANGRPGLTYGPYTLDSLIGRGGMGSVWRAHRHDGRYEGTVAVKLLNSALLEPAAERRFRREGEILARLQHPHIARLLDAGVGEDSQPYLVLELVDGTPIDEYCREQALSVQARVELFDAVLDAVAHAHAKLIVHRDLKPSNILVDRSGQVKLLDFGIAKLLDDDDGRRAPETALTVEGGRVLTPDYAAPEQVIGGDVTTATDVYALGVLLFELLTGARPYRVTRESAGELEQAILTGDPYRPSERASDTIVRRQLTGDLDTIVLKALRKSADERYPSVLALADDLQRWRDGRPVLARPATLGYRASRFVRRHALAVSAAAAVLIAVVGGAGVSLWQASVARAEQQRAEEVTTFIERIFADADPYKGDGTPVNATDLLVQARGRLDETLGQQDETRLELLLLMAHSLVNLEAYQEAEPIAEEARALAVRMHGADDVRALRADMNMTEVHRFLGRLDAMDSTVERTYAALRRMAVPDSELLVTTLGNRAHVAIDRGRPNDAVEPAREALRVAEAFYPAGHDEIVTAAQVLAVSMQNGDATPEEALAAAERSMVLTRARYAETPSHPRMVEGMLLYGRALGNAGDPREAIRVHEEAAAASSEARGEANFMRAFIFGNAGKYRSDLGQYAGALADYDSALTILASVGDTIGASYAITLGNRADMLERLGRHAESLVPIRQSVRLLRDLWGEDHPRVAITELRMAVAEAEIGRTAEARRRLDAVATRGVPADQQGALAYARGVVARRAGVPAEAVRWQTVALAATTDTSSLAASRERARMYVELARAQLALGAREPAADALERAIAAFRAAEMDTTADEQWALAGLARVRSGGRG